MFARVTAKKSREKQKVGELDLKATPIFFCVDAFKFSLSLSLSFPLAGTTSTTTSKNSWGIERLWKRRKRRTQYENEEKKTIGPRYWVQKSAPLPQLEKATRGRPKQKPNDGVERRSGKGKKNIRWCLRECVCVCVGLFGYFNASLPSSSRLGRQQTTYPVCVCVVVFSTQKCRHCVISDEADNKWIFEERSLFVFSKIRRVNNNDRHTQNKKIEQNGWLLVDQFQFNGG